MPAAIMAPPARWEALRPQEDPAADGDAGVPAPGEFHAWLVRVRPRAGWLNLLDPAELERLECIGVPEDRVVFITSRAAQRLIGSRYLGIAPEAVSIVRDCAHCGSAVHGRPRFAGAAPARSALDYSVSHTCDWLLIVVTGGGLVGVDIESDDSCRDAEGLAGITLAPGERGRFALLPPHERTRWLLAAWTRKEAAMKLAGLGLAAPPRRLDVTGPVVSASDVRGWPAAPAFLHTLAAPARHAAALASTVPVAAVRPFTVH